MPPMHRKRNGLCLIAAALSIASAACGQTPRGLNANDLTNALGFPVPQLNVPNGAAKLDASRNLPLPGTLLAPLAKLGGTGWLEALIPGTENAAPNGMVSLSSAGASAGIFGMRTSDSVGAGGQVFALGAFSINNNATQVMSSYGQYVEARRYAGAGITHGVEINMTNQGNTVPVTPYPTTLLGMSAALWLSSGRTDVLASTNASLAIGITNNGKPFAEGITFQAGSLAGTDNTAGSTGSAAAISMPRGDEIRWFEPTTNTVAARIRSDVTTATGTGGNIVFANSGIAFQTAANVGIVDFTPTAALFSTPVGVQGGGTTPTPVYNAIYPSVTFVDQFSSSIAVTTNTIVQKTAVAGYFRNQAPAVAGGTGNAVGLFAAGTAEVNGAASWGINALLQDSATRAIGTGTGRTLSNEFDFNVMNPATRINGVSVGGNSLAQPTSADGFIVNPLGTGIKWVGAFTSQDGAAQFGLLAGAMALTGANTPSQYVTFAYRDSANARQTATWQAVSNSGTRGYMALTSTGGVDVSLSGQTLYAGGVNVGSSTLSGSIYATGLPTCASAPISGSICRDTTTTPATLKVIP